MLRRLRPSTPRLSAFAIVFAILFVLFSCRKRTDGPYAVIDPDDAAPPIATGDEPGLVVRLSNADPSAEDRERPKVAKATPLSESEVKKVLARLPAQKTEPDDEKELALREGSAPPPRTGATVLGAFPPAKKARPGKTKKPAGPLEVVRFAPEGDVPIAPHLAVTFSHPMVAVTSLQELAKGDLPVSLDPVPPEGKWRWIGTKTLLFEPTTRMPMATEYTVSVPKGTKSAVGTSTAKAVTWTFTTPPPKVETFHPQGGPTRLQPVMFAGFDQRIDPEEVVGAITLRAGRKGRFPVRLAERGEIEADDVVRRLAAEAEDGR